MDGMPRTEVEVQAIIDEMVRRIVTRFDPVRVILFGSRARGDARWDSDVDLLVVLREVDDYHRARVAIRRALSDIPWAKDILVATSADLLRERSYDWSILRTAQSEGRVVYERRRAA